MGRKLDVNKWSEGLDYKLIPVDYVDHKDAWDVRILRGHWTETVIRYGTISMSGLDENLRFDFRVVSSPDPDATSEDVQLQDVAGDILFDILDRGFTEGYVYGKEIEGEDIGNKTRTNDSAESTNE
tara:strand:- start:1414 stop:1791 length:378 start_codon:yes stop_codon:yes gene_type:complete